MIGVKMRKKALILACAMFLSLASVPAYADHGMPSEPLYTVALNIYGADYYSDYTNVENNSASGKLPGGTAFYVWSDYYEDGRLWGTTNANAGTEQSDTFVYIYRSDVVSDTEPVSPEVGQKEAASVHAVTDDELNLRCGPGTGFKSLKVLDKGTEVTYDYTFTTDTKWMYVQAAGVSGWVCGDYLKTVESTESGSEPSVQNTVAPPVDTDTAEPVQDKRGIVAGIVLICIGVAVLIAAFVLYYLRKKKKEVESLKVR